ncbi:MAG: GNAT family N-acetyltransferase [Burkholderiales bacterium]|nr:GNAT family N-acetyltransferase [Burkholderiales bacterium]
MSAERASIRALTDAEVEALCALAGEIWREHYPAIIGQAQIEYMLAQRYRPEVIRAELARGGVWWDLLLAGGEPRGYASYFLGEAIQEMKLDKLYVHGECRGRGYGAMMLQRALSAARANGCERLVLAVNKHNAGAIAAYRGWGFAIARSSVTDIGGGFVMDDYIMTRAL